MFELQSSFKSTLRQHHLKMEIGSNRNEFPVRSKRINAFVQHLTQFLNTKTFYVPIVNWRQFPRIGVTHGL
jgi:hypothetical protein